MSKLRYITNFKRVLFEPNWKWLEALCQDEQEKDFDRESKERKIDWVQLKAFLAVHDWLFSVF